MVSGNACACDVWSVSLCCGFLYTTTIFVIVVIIVIITPPTPYIPQGVSTRRPDCDISCNDARHSMLAVFCKAQEHGGMLWVYWLVNVAVNAPT